MKDFTWMVMGVTLAWAVFAIGCAGESGTPGGHGSEGEDGTPGAQGPKGETGPAGKNGVNGAQGPAGLDGEPGPQGEAGPQGLAGAQGEKGATGATGTAGPQGPTGLAGAVGPQGPQGVAGPAGATGPSGTISAASLYTKQTVAQTLPRSTTTTLIASCDAGDIVLSGGCGFGWSSGSTRKITTSAPATGGWQCIFNDVDSSAVPVAGGTATALCLAQ